MKFKVYDEKRCEICGRMYIPKSGNSRTCSTHCSRKLNAMNKKKHYQYDAELKRGLTLTEIEERKKPAMDQLTKDAIAANRAGVSYGQYMSIIKPRKKRDMEWNLEFSRIKKAVKDSYGEEEECLQES